MKKFKKIIVAMLCLCVMLGMTACGNDDVTDKNQGVVDDVGDAAGNVVDDAGDAAGNVVDDIGNGVKDITDDVTGNETKK